MIKSKAELRRYLKTERAFYVEKTAYGRWVQILTYDVKLLIYKLVKFLRCEEYHHNQEGIIHKILYGFYRRKRSKLGIKLGIELCDNTFEEGLVIYHAGNIVVNGMSKIGQNFKMHGSNCVGNNGKTLECPIIGNNVRLGVGAKVIGGVTLADDIVVAAGAVVVHSFEEPGITIAGIPARKVSS